MLIFLASNTKKVPHLVETTVYSAPKSEASKPFKAAQGVLEGRCSSRPPPPPTRPHSAPSIEIRGVTNLLYPFKTRFLVSRLRESQKCKVGVRRLRKHLGIDICTLSSAPPPQ